ncbi:hypothetical protein [Phytomonospora endophytica]|uniref:Uncharacterized protein n=1 Tax=Phytomonospora endophytica TaxID=714109 RepID=A0A841FLF2_9ACTN|nr:hypothetical protein [Phytomonospora endophytica]MBB6036986.1 hypothetical protein [Phytomonospora endophytica]GIG69470.1 hypothetical protein Pen01_57650 [Phytomonospora endophytica]
MTGTARYQRGRLVPALGLLAAAWAVPVVTHLISLDWLLLPLMVGAVACVIRAGRSLVDRLMISLFITLGGIIVFGLAYSAWPWGLSPVPIAGTWFTGLLAIAFFTDRRPSVPTRLLGSDLLIASAAVVGGLMARWPVLGRDFETSLRYTSAREDMFRHFSLFDAIGYFGGYPVFNEPEVTRITADMDVYPPGAHFLYAAVDNFLRSSSAPGDTEVQFWNYYGYTAIGFGLLCATLVWATRWAAGPTVAGWRRALVCAFVGVVVVSGPLTTLFWQGYDSEIIGLALLAVTFALLLRPPPSAYEWITTVTLLAAATVITYNLFALFLPAAAVAAVIAYRKRLAPIWKYTVGAIVVAGAAASFVFWQQLLVGLGPSHTNEIGGIVPFDRGTVAALGLVVVAAMLSRTGRRVAVWPIAAVTIVIGLGIVMAFAVQQLAAFGETRYYLEKLIHVVYVLALVGVGAVALFLKPWRGLGSRRLEEGVPALAALVIMVVAAGMLPSATDKIFTAWPTFHPGPNTTWAQGWTSRKVQSPFDDATKALVESDLIDGSPSLVVYNDDGHFNRHVTMFVGVLNRDTGTITPPMELVDDIDGLGNPALDADGRVTGPAADALNALKDAIRATEYPLQVIVGNQAVAAELAEFSLANPNLKLRVEYLPEMQLA